MSGSRPSARAQVEQPSTTQLNIVLQCCSGSNWASDATTSIQMAVSTGMRCCAQSPFWTLLNDLVALIGLEAGMVIELDGLSV